ncbi:hypothetical protein M0G43_10965 [Subsaxibacter sp. CAU 1640]|uniref:hypothetical protein n=1 Tax=Subsaxibacter sp. CAU 1640 TaxID=2933271 RepID=UPI00200454DF|nr:hypothetical protein [Subsaxibacter sp. CAU 1640]MCK7591096.1 hypothetical protein [Subsaxibacter sp. CAU 1640]
MKRIIILLIISYSTSFLAQETTRSTSKDSLLIIDQDPDKGFYSNYLLFIPKGTPQHQTSYLLVEPNNTGKTSDTLEVHTAYAIDLASVNSIGNNIASMLKIPLLVPIFPRPDAQPLLYTHALDRDVMLEQTPIYKRLDLQLLAMIDDARTILKGMHISTHDQLFMNGFSASATFINRFSFIHPETIKAMAMGGFNGELMLPQNKIDSAELNYPLGINDFEELLNKKFDKEQYQNIAQYIYMGALDDNDAVQYDDAYSDSERHLINKHIGSNVQERYGHCQTLYIENGITAIFKTFDNVGHWTTSEMNLATINFFLKQME